MPYEVVQGANRVKCQKAYIKIRLSGAKSVERPNWRWLEDMIAWKRVERFDQELEVKDSLDDIAKYMFENAITRYRFRSGIDVERSTTPSGNFFWTWAHDMIWKIPRYPRAFHREMEASAWEVLDLAMNTTLRAIVRELENVLSCFPRIESRIENYRDRYPNSRRGRRFFATAVDEIQSESSTDCYARQFILSHQTTDMGEPTNQYASIHINQCAPFETLNPVTHAEYELDSVQM